MEQELDELKQIRKDIIKLEKEITYPNKKIEEGVSMSKEVSLLRQQIYELKQQNLYLQEQINNLTGKDIQLTDANKRQDEAICSIKIFDWCMIK